MDQQNQIKGPIIIVMAKSHRSDTKIGPTIRVHVKAQ